MCDHFLKALVIACAIKLTLTQEGAQYLQDTIRDLKNNMEPQPNPNRRHSNLQVVTNATPIKRAHAVENVPTLHLTKAELAALYESAVNKGETIKLDTGMDGSAQKINAAVHELGASASNSVHHVYKNNELEKDPGYYYYYYPLKSFMDELSSSGFQHESMKLHEHDYHEIPPTAKPHHHSHTHKHNVHIEPMKNMMDMDKKSKGLEPLFMAISGFIGMTIMFILSILVLPKFQKLKPKGFKHDSDAELTSITRIAMQAIEGHNCAERLACEAGKAARAFNLYDNRFVKLMRRMAPKYVVKQIDKVGKYTDKKLKCAAIPCKKGQDVKPKIIKRKPKLLI